MHRLYFIAKHDFQWPHRKYDDNRFIISHFSSLQWRKRNTKIWFIKSWQAWVEYFHDAHDVFVCTNLSLHHELIFWILPTDPHAEGLRPLEGWRHMTELTGFKSSIKGGFYWNLVETHSRLFFELASNWT